jgi:hypothetical protein
MSFGVRREEAFHEVRHAVRPRKTRRPVARPPPPGATGAVRGLHGVADDVFERVVTEPRSKVSFEIEDVGEMVKLPVVHEGFEDGSAVLTLISQGRPRVPPDSSHCSRRVRCCRRPAELSKVPFDRADAGATTVWRPGLTRRLRQA